MIPALGKIDEHAEYDAILTIIEIDTTEKATLIGDRRGISIKLVINITNIPLYTFDLQDQCS